MRHQICGSKITYLAFADFLCRRNHIWKDNESKYQFEERAGYVMKSAKNDDQDQRRDLCMTS